MSLKHKVLALLEENIGETISGSEIARRVGMTRSAVWKAVRQLRSEGYIIYATTNRGYSISEENSFLDEASIIKGLTTREIGRKTDIFKTIDSTNTFAKSLAQLGAVHGTTVISETQSQGRGRMGRSFYSPLGMGLYMSVILRPKLSIEHSLLITSCAAVAVAEAIEKVTNLNCKIKWVNDIYVNKKKLCGILTEAAVNPEQGGLDYAVVGIGLNMQNTSFPKDIADIATSLYMETGENFSKNLLASEILNRLEARFDTILDKSFINSYKNRSNLIGKRIEIIHNNTVTCAQCIGIDDICRLIVRYDNGEEKALMSGTIRVVE